MKLKLFFVFVFGLLLGNSKIILAQGVKDVFDSNAPITWLGIDFTGGVFNGDREKLGSEADMKNLMSSMNRLITNERDKFNLSAMLQKNKVDYSNDVAINHNEKLNFSNLCSDTLGHILHKQDIEAIVKSYDYGDLKGLGLMFNVEVFSKLVADQRSINNAPPLNSSKMGVNAFVWVTFIDIDHKQVIFTERMQGKPSGFGLRNYWAGAIYSIMKNVSRKSFEQWKRKYNR